MQQVRKDCVNFMIKHREQYETLVTGDFNQYVQTMAKAETLGTLTELRAMGYLFKRNITLFRPKQLGKMFVDEVDYRDQAPLRIFHSNVHFDSVFEKPYIIDAAFCQCEYLIFGSNHSIWATAIHSIRLHMFTCLFASLPSTRLRNAVQKGI